MSRALYAPLLGDVPLRCVVEQPENRGTAPAILHGLLRVATATPLGLVALFPSDHYVSDDAVFMAHVDAAFEAARERPDLVILFGMIPESPEVAYGWIEPGEPIPVPHGPLRRVRRFWEKPSAAVAETLLRRGALWNSFVIVARATALLALVRRATPQLYEGFAGVRAAVGTAREAESLRHLYARLPSVNFSREVLARRAANLAVLPVRGVDWCDLGEPDRVVATLARLGRSVTWREPAAVASA